jgi:hypothetical protein
MENITMVIIPREEWMDIKNQQVQILEHLKELQKPKHIGIRLTISRQKNS